MEIVQAFVSDISSRMEIGLVILIENYSVRSIGLGKSASLRDLRLLVLFGFLRT
jgi:hypothetical protein